MKRQNFLRSMLCLLVALVCPAAWTQSKTSPATEVVDLTQLSNDNVYTLSSKRAFLFYKEGANKLYSSNGKAAGSVTLDKTNPNHQFRIEKKSDNYYLYSVGAQKYVGGNGSYVTNASTVLKMENVGGAYPWKLFLGSNGMNSQDGGQTDNGIKVDTWTTTDAGNCYQIVEAGEKSGSGLEELELTIQNSQFIYDLQGRKVDFPAKGIYIKGNKKVLF